MCVSVEMLAGVRQPVENFECILLYPRKKCKLTEISHVGSCKQGKRRVLDLKSAENYGNLPRSSPHRNRAVSRRDTS